MLCYSAGQYHRSRESLRSQNLLQPMCLQMYSNFLANTHFRVTPQRSCSTFTHRGVYYSKLAIHFTVFIVTLFVVTPCMCAKQPLPWWTDSCNRGPSYEVCSWITNPSSIRHGRSPVEVRDQLKILIGYLKRNSKRLNQLYQNITHNSMIQPRAEIKELDFNEMTRRMKKSKKFHMIKFHVNLQKIARYMDRMVKAEQVSLDNNDLTPRRCYLAEVVYVLKTLLCEVTEALDDRDLKPRLVKSGKKVTWKLSTTDMFMKDITVLSKTQMFLKASRRSLMTNKKRHPARRLK